MTRECNARVGIAPTPIGLDGIWEFRFEEGKSIEEVSDPGFAATDAMAVPGCFDTLPKWYRKRGTALYRRAFTLPDRDQGASGIDVMARRFRERFSP